jgi:uncharacterized membrane protein/ketosteroid isomerase-like protein
MNSLIEPNIHPILVHFAYALSVSAAFAYVLSFLPAAARWRDTLRPAADWMLAFAAIAIVATIAAGFQAYYSVDHDAPSHAVMTTHRNWAVPSGTAIILLAAWRWRQRAQAVSGLFAALLAGAALSLTVTAWWGGKAVYGHGLGVKSLPVVTGHGHDHQHGAEADHDEANSESTEHDNSDGHHDEAAMVDDMMADSAGMDAGHDHSGEAAHDEDTDVQPSVAPAPSAAGSPEATADAFSAALRSGDKAAVRALTAPDVLVAEGGGLESSLDEYAGHHMPADMAFLAAVETTLMSRKVIAAGDMASVVSESQMHGTYKDKTVHAASMETMVRRREGDAWKIIHIHWSSAPIAGDHEH